VCILYGQLLLFPSFEVRATVVRAYLIENSKYFYTWSGPSANLEFRSEMCCTRLTGNTGRKKSPFWHHRTTLSGYIFGTKACIDNRKKNLLNSNTSSSTCLDNMVNFGLQTAEICWRVWGTPANFNGFHVFAALLHGTRVVGVSQTLWRWTEGSTYIRQGGHHVGHWPTFLVDRNIFSRLLSRQILLAVKTDFFSANLRKSLNMLNKHQCV